MTAIGEAGTLAIACITEKRAYPISNRGVELIIIRSLLKIGTIAITIKKRSLNLGKVVN